jgi:hypothetical protein
VFSGNSLLFSLQKRVILVHLDRFSSSSRILVFIVVILAVSNSVNDLLGG